jgi:hypothetical protein
MNETIIDGAAYRIAVLNIFFNGAAIRNYSRDHLKELCEDRTGAAYRFAHFWNSKQFEYKQMGRPSAAPQNSFGKVL